MNAKEKKLKAELIKVLKAKRIYEKEVDDSLIDSIIFNLHLISEAKKDILKRGVMVNIAKGDNEFYQQNFAIGIYHNAIKSINTLLKQLGLEKAKIETKATDDEDGLVTLKKLLSE